MDSNIFDNDIPDMERSMIGEPVKRQSGVLTPGETILNHYKVLSILGKGGMGVVYECFDEDAGIKVAVKTLAPELSASVGEMEQIKENFQLVHNLHHENIASYNTLVRDSVSGMYYLVMEYVDGDDLRCYIKRKKEQNEFTEQLVSRLVRQIADALD